ncbi:MAG: hypothetical protein L0219_13530 [Phycisphaerales bacterium]|nr:hypothetical protein [Phycisphaerales bacterium]
MFAARATKLQRHSVVRLMFAVGVGVACIGEEDAVGGGSTTLPTTNQDFFQPGTQPLGAGLPGKFTPILEANQCNFCHDYETGTDPFFMHDPFTTWQTSMMGQSARDPLFYAGLTIANQDAAGAGEYCIRCHVPVAYLADHFSPPDGTAFDSADMNGVQCNFCHRLVDPAYKPGISPSEDEAILNDLAASGLLAPESNNSRFVVDPTDTRRGPFADIADDPLLNVHPAVPPGQQPDILYSPFHSSSEFCWNCHGVSNALMTKQPDGSYALGALDQPHPTQDQRDMFPLHRTYSEWKNSYYSSVGVDHDGLFGGNHPTGIMKVCQDCHMPDMQGFGCSVVGPFFERPDIPQHSFVGSNTWVLSAIQTVDFNQDGLPDYPDSGLDDELVAGAVVRNTDFLQRASTLTVTRQNQDIKVRVLNKTGHKLPTGFPDGRRIWINMKFMDCNDQILLEDGAYDFETATLDPLTTRVYEMRLGIDGAEYAALVGHPEGETFHFILANKILKDNRIPPAGFSNVLAQQNQTASVGATYLNGQNWDDTIYAMPEGTTKTVVAVYYQLTSREFIEFMRDANTTDNRGQVVYDLWVEYGKSAPVLMDLAEVPIYKAADVNEDGTVDVSDLLGVIGNWGVCNPPPPLPCLGDLNGDGLVNITDLLGVVEDWGPC